MIKFVIAFIFMIATFLPTWYSWITYKWVIAEDDKKNSDKVYTVSNISLDSIEGKLKDVQKINISDYK